jgi:hypothetical protein
LDYDLIGGSRVSKVRELLREARLSPAGREKVWKLVELVADPKEYGDDASTHQSVIEHLNNALVDDGLELRPCGGRFKVMKRDKMSPVVTQLAGSARKLDLGSVSSDLERALINATHDPEDSITAACSTVEGVCKCILEDLKVPLPANKDIQGLVKAVAKELNLDPARQDLPDEHRQDIRQILGGLQTVAAGIGALRTHAGDAHGRGRKPVKVDARIARLAVHAASTISLFYIETWQLHHGALKS